MQEHAIDSRREGGETLTAGLLAPSTSPMASLIAGVLPMKLNSGAKTGLRAGPSVRSKGSFVASCENADSAALFCVLGRLLLPCTAVDTYGASQCQCMHWPCWCHGSRGAGASTQQ